MAYSDRPTAQDFERLLDRLAPEIVRRLGARGLSETEMAVWMEEALTELAWRWNRVGDRERWLLERLDKETGNPSPRKEPEHD
jgi:hypothetical protein